MIQARLRRQALIAQPHPIKIFTGEMSQRGKKLKALLIAGNEEIKSPEHKAYRKTYNKFYDKIVKSRLEKYHNLGTSENILVKCT